MPKDFARDGSDFRPLAVGLGSCLATDRITVDGRPIGYMYRERPDNETDSGWRFFAGDETEDYANNPNNLGIYDVNTIANYDSAIVSHLSAPVGAAFVRNGLALIFEAIARSN